MKYDILLKEAIDGAIASPEERAALNVINKSSNEENSYGARPDGTAKGKGWLGELKLPNGKVATEYSVSANIDGKEILYPTLVPTLTKEEKELMINDIIPNNKRVPEVINKKAIEHALKQIKAGKSAFK